MSDPLARDPFDNLRDQMRRNGNRFDVRELVFNQDGEWRMRAIARRPPSTPGCQHRVLERVIRRTRGSVFGSRVLDMEVRPCFECGRARVLEPRPPMCADGSGRSFGFGCDIAPHAPRYPLAVQGGFIQVVACARCYRWHGLVEDMRPTSTVAMVAMLSCSGSDAVCGTSWDGSRTQDQPLDGMTSSPLREPRFDISTAAMRMNLMYDMQARNIFRDVPMPASIQPVPRISPVDAWDR